EPQSRITILYDAFGNDASMKKDWGFSALVEVAGKRILFDTGNDRDTFAANVKAKGVDLTNLDFVVVSHRHGDHMAGLSYVLSVNPKCEDLCAQGRLRHFWLLSAVELLSEGRFVAPRHAVLRRHTAGGDAVRYCLAGCQFRAYRQDHRSGPRHYAD